MATANVHNETDPCGWKKKPLGGLARKATIIDNLRSEGFDVLILDAGNLLFKKDFYRRRMHFLKTDFKSPFIKANHK